MTRVLTLLRWLVLTEVRMYVGAVRFLTRRYDVPAGATPHPYVGAVSLALWVFTIVSAVELVALHLIIPWEAVRLASDVVGIWGVVWCLGLTGCHYVYPHLATSTTLRVRETRRRDTVTVPWDQVAALRVRERGIDEGRAVQVVDDVLVVAVGKRTNVELELHAPLEVTVRGQAHAVRRVRLFADDPQALRASAAAAQG